MGLSQLQCEIVLWFDQPQGTAMITLQNMLQDIPGQVSLGGALGREHTYQLQATGQKHIKIIRHLDRNMNYTLLIDHDMDNYAQQPGNTLLVDELTDENVDDDKTLMTLLAMFKRT